MTPIYWAGTLYVLGRINVESIAQDNNWFVYYPSLHTDKLIWACGHPREDVTPVVEFAWDIANVNYTKGVFSMDGFSLPPFESTKYQKKGVIYEKSQMAL